LIAQLLTDNSSSMSCAMLCSFKFSPSEGWNW